MQSKQSKQSKGSGRVYRWGGRRKGSGQKPGFRPGTDKRFVGHRRREAVHYDTPVLVTMVLADGLPCLRTDETAEVIHNALLAAKDRFENFRVVEFTIQSNHFHLICEADSTEELSQGMQGLTVRFAKQLNKHWGRRGKVFGDRYHAVVIRRPLQMRRALIYVLQNDRKHHPRVGAVGRKRWEPDRFSSGPWFDGWKDRRPVRGLPPCPTSKPKSWLLIAGWRQLGDIDYAEEPSSARRGRCVAA